MSILLTVLDGIARETMTLASVGLLAGGIDDVLVDAVYWSARLAGRHHAVPVAALPASDPSVIAIFVAAWDESAVIGAMLRNAIDRFGDDPGYRLFVGTYPNDEATVAAVAAIADERVRLVVNPRPGPTTKADCLNRLWDALIADEAARGWRARAVMLHDAEDVVHRDELRVCRAYLAGHGVVQIPVLPLVDRHSRWVSGHYIDEFAYAHGAALVARTALGASLPLAGVGCAIDRDILAAIAVQRGGEPFDATSLTEDYELGLMIDAMGVRQAFARVTDADGGLVAVREYFPATLGEAVRQKARWMTGIAFSGWDRLGWGRALDWGEHWMRMRDRRGPLAVIVLFAAWLALVSWGLTLPAHWLAGEPWPVVDPMLAMLLTINAWLLLWRLAMRAWFTGTQYGLREALRSIPRVLVSNGVALLAMRLALDRYVASLRGAPARWDKTAHRFPAGSAVQ